jgi:uncharacterized coiled-coil DUF342 family protein
MANRKIEHPLRTIEISFDERKPFHPFEEEMLERYTGLHSFVKELSEEYSEVQSKYEAHDNNIRKVISRFRAMKFRMNFLGSEAKRLINTMTPERTEAQAIIDQAAEFQILLKDFHRDVQKLADESDTMHRFFVPLDNKDEHLTEVFDEYKECREKLYGDTGNYSLDLHQYDADEQDFLSSLSNMVSRQDEFVSICNRVIDRYNMLVEEVEKTYEQWEQYNKMIDMLRLNLRTPYDLSRICLN